MTIHIQALEQLACLCSTQEEGKALPHLNNEMYIHLNNAFWIALLPHSKTVNGIGKWNVFYIALC